MCQKTGPKNQIGILPAVYPGKRTGYRLPATRALFPWPWAHNLLKPSQCRSQPPFHLHPMIQGNRPMGDVPRDDVIEDP